MLGQAILEGLAAGFLLSIFVGPIFFTMLQLGVEHGFKAAFSLAAGQWFSDFLFIFLAFWSADFVRLLVENEASRNNFIWYSGTIGGGLLLLFGLALIFTSSASTAGNAKAEKVFDKTGNKKSNLAYFAYFTQGFLINTFNPTPLLFWVGLMGTAISRNYSNLAISTTFTTVILVVIGTDLAKIALAKAIKKKIKAKHILLLRKVAGSVLATFGLSLLIKVTFL